MLLRKHKKSPLNINDDIIINHKIEKHEKVPFSELDKVISHAIGNSSSKNLKIMNSLNESNSHMNEVSSNLFNKLGIVTVNNSNVVGLTLTKRVDLYLGRFPEIEYLIDMLSSSIIYTSSSNTKKIQVAINGEHKSVTTPTTPPKDPMELSNTITDTSDEEPVDYYDPNEGNESTTLSDGSTTTEDIPEPTNTSTLSKTTPLASTEADVKNDVYEDNAEQVDSYYKDMSVEIGNLFKKNNIKLSLYNLMFSILKYGCGVFYFDNTNKYDSVSFYGLDEIKFVEAKKEYENSYVHASLIAENEEETDGNALFTTADDDDHIKVLKSSTIKVFRLEDGVQLKNANMYFIAEKGIFGKSLVDKVINYLKIIELLELSLLIERLSKSKTTHIWKLDLSKIEEEDVASTLMLYRNLINSKSSMNFDENTDQMSFDIVKNLIDSNLIVPTEDDNLKIDTLKSEYKPLLDDIEYWWDKVYHTMGIPLHYRKSSGTKTYVNSNMLSLHDNVYAMKIRHWQVILNNLLTFWIDKWVAVNYKDLTIKFLNVNIPEFIPISERKETDLDKSAKFVTMFTQLEQMLNIQVKDAFIIEKLFPNDLISDIIDVEAQKANEAMDTEELDTASVDSTEPETQDDITSLFESGLDKLTKKTNNNKRIKRRSNIFNTGLKKKSNETYSWNMKLNVEW